LEYAFYFGGRNPEQGRYRLWGSGIAPKEMCAATNLVQLNVHIKPEVFLAFINNSTEGLPNNLHHLVRSCDRLYYCRRGVTTPIMQRVVPMK
jgi:hypothetical protein